MSDSIIAAKFGLDLPFVHAIRVTESGGDASAIRFEPHIFHRDRPLSKLAIADVAWSHHDHHTGAEILAHADPAELARAPYTPGPGRAASDVRAETNRAALIRAMGVDADRAIRAASFGAFQVLGWALLVGGPGPEEALHAFDAAPASMSDVLLERWLDKHPDAVEAARHHDIVRWVMWFNGGDARDPKRHPRAVRYVARMKAALAAAQWPAAG